MSTDQTALQELFSKYVKGQCSAGETLELFRLIAEHQHDPELLVLLDAELAETTAAEDYDPLWDNTLAKIKERTDEPERRRVFPTVIRPLYLQMLVAAGLAVMVIGAVLFYYRDQPKAVVQSLAAYDHAILPGKQGATLTLDNGKKIKLDGVSNGELAKESGMVINKSATGSISYSGAAEADEGGRSIKRNTLSTARGETYQLRLPDGSVVWLNAASNLTYNLPLNVNGKRVVHLTGEAYFEIAKDKAHPFIVESRDQQTEVLGTHFNVSAYEDEATAKTILEEGSVKVSSISQPSISVMLKPGQESVFSKEHLAVAPADLDAGLSWVKGDFIFNEEPLESVLRKVSRWYDVEIVYSADVPRDLKIGGFLSRSRPVSAVLERIQKATHLKFRVEGNTIYVNHHN